MREYGTLAQIVRAFLFLVAADSVASELRPGEGVVTFSVGSGIKKVASAGIVDGASFSIKLMKKWPRESSSPSSSSFSFSYSSSSSSSSSLED